MEAHPQPLSRRTMLKLGMGAAALLAVGGGAAWLWRPGVANRRLTASGRAVFLAVARAVLEGSLPADAAAREQALRAHAAHLDETLASLPVATRSELGLLLALLAVAPGRRWLTGLEVDWSDADTPAVQAALDRMRRDHEPLRLQAYHALRDLNNAAFYAQTAHWPLLGYPGPTPLDRKAAG